MAALDVLRRNVRALMGHQRIRPADLSRAIGVTPSAVTNFLKEEQGLDIRHLDALAQALRTTVPDLFTDRDLLASGQRVGSESGAADVVHAYEVVSKRLLQLVMEKSDHPTHPAAPPQSRRARRPRKSR